MTNDNTNTKDEASQLNWVQKAAIGLVALQAARITYRLAKSLSEGFKSPPPEDEMTRRWRKTVERQARRREERGR